MSNSVLSSDQCKRHRYVALRGFVRERHIMHKGTVHLTAMQIVKCEKCGVVKSRPGGSLFPELHQ